MSFSAFLLVFSPFLTFSCQYPTGLGTNVGEFNYDLLDLSVNPRSLLPANIDIRDQQEPEDIVLSANLDNNICDDPEFDCTDISTPWGIALTAINEIWERSVFDGFNALGTYNRVVNPIPYQDYRDEPYVPRNDPWKVKKKTKWQPLLETDGIGFLFNQEHVAPHVGFTGTTFFLDDDYYCSLEAPDPNYDYDLEVELLLNRMSNLNDSKKMLVERFDDKLASLNNLRNQFRNPLGLRDVQPIDSLGVLAFFITLHESMVVV